MGWVWLVGPAVLWLGVALFIVGDGRQYWRPCGRTFAWGLLAFPLALGLQSAVFAGHDLAKMPPFVGILAVLLVVGPSEEFFKAVLVRWRYRSPFLPLYPREAAMLGVCAGAGYAFSEHFFRFLDPATAPAVLVSKGTLGTALHVLVSLFWSRRFAMGPENAGERPWLTGVGKAGLIHGLYNAGSFSCGWFGLPIQAGWAWQGVVVAALAVCFGRGVAALPALPPPAPEPQDAGPDVDRLAGSVPGSWGKEDPTQRRQDAKTPGNADR